MTDEPTDEATRTERVTVSNDDTGMTFRVDLELTTEINKKSGTTQVIPTVEDADVSVETTDD